MMAAAKQVKVLLALITTTAFAVTVVATLTHEIVDNQTTKAAPTSDDPKLVYASLRAADAGWASVIDRCGVHIGGEVPRRLLARAAALREEAAGFRRKASALLQKAELAEMDLTKIKSKTFEVCALHNRKDEKQLRPKNPPRDPNNDAVRQLLLPPPPSTFAASTRAATLSSRSLARFGAAAPHRAQGAARDMPARTARQKEILLLPRLSPPMMPAPRKDSTVLRDSVSNATTALRTFYVATGGAECWVNATGWSDTASHDPCGGWFGVTCEDDGVVSALVLPNNGLCGAIPNDGTLAQLEGLRMLDLSSNVALQGELPKALPRSLTHLNLCCCPKISRALSSKNSQGTLPTQYAVLTNLVVLDLHLNPGLKGMLPTQYSALTKVMQFTLDSNSGLTGTLPTQYAALTNIEIFGLQANPGLKGTLPTQYSFLTNLVYFYLHTNPGLKGDLPSQYGLMRSVRALDLHNCTGLAGATIPETWAASLANLEVLDLSAIGLSGSLPKSWLGRDLDFPWSAGSYSFPIANGMVFDLRSEARLDPNPVLRSLRELNLAHNNLSQNGGSALRRASTLRSLVVLDLSDNRLGGEIKDEDLYAVGNAHHDAKRQPDIYTIATFPRLVSLWLANNRVERLPGTDWLSSNNESSAAQLVILYASGNALHGDEPIAKYPYGGFAVIDLSSNPDYAPGGDTVPSFMRFDNFTQLPQQQRLNCNCPGVTRANVTDRNVAWTLDPHYYNYSECTCAAGFGGERCVCTECEPGTKSVNGDCEPCQGHSYSNTAGAGACTACKPNTCHGHGSCLLAADDNLNGSKYDCTCDFMYRGSSNCHMPVVGILTSVSAALVAGLVAALAYRYRRVTTRRLRSKEDEATGLRSVLAVAEGDIATLQRSWRIDEAHCSFGPKVAEGAFGIVRRGTWMGRAVAIKEIKSPHIPSRLFDGGETIGTDDNFNDGEPVHGAAALWLCVCPRPLNVTISTLPCPCRILAMLELRHPRLCLFHGCGRRSTNTRRFLVMEWMVGGALFNRLHDAEGHPTTADVPSAAWRVRCALDVAEGLAFIHASGFVHRQCRMHEAF